MFMIRWFNLSLEVINSLLIDGFKWFSEIMIFFHWYTKLYNYKKCNKYLHYILIIISDFILIA